MTSRWFKDSKERQLRAERAAAMELRNAYNDPAVRETLPDNLKIAAIDLLTADQILEASREAMRSEE